MIDRDYIVSEVDRLVGDGWGREDAVNFVCGSYREKALFVLGMCSAGERRLVRRLVRWGEGVRVSLLEDAN